MGLSVGIVGLPNVGKSTIFNALTAAGAQSANYPFCTIEPNVGIVPVNDPRLVTIAKLAESKQIVFTDLKVVDIAGLVRGASKGEGLGNQFLANIRETDAILHVVRCFDDPNVVHVEGSVDPERDVEVIETELLLADLDALAKRNERVSRLARVGQKEYAGQAEALAKAIAAVEKGTPLRAAGLSDEERDALAELNLITMKPVLYVANVAENDLGQETPLLQKLRRVAADKGGEIVVICGELEAQIAQLPPEERIDFLKEMGLDEPGLAVLVRAAYKLLDLETFFTAGPKEARAWTIHRGSRAPQAAGKIHSDFERGFIRAETIGFDDYIACKGEQGAKAAGKMRSEGKDYEVQDGDVILFRFNV
ncbi:MAG: redox-regulated ATPase YchF [Acidobacteria bacterium]|nr:redox-regulated ATPase YchF [Acidobacteriota bacterium]MBV9478797.1 redox-regulated ATPase YchF [Acidobacteriota bacterium]